jgi:hypothetical protein
LVTQGLLRPGLSPKLPMFPLNISIDRPEETAWVSRTEDWRGQVLSRTKQTESVLSLVSVLTGNDLMRSGVPVL